LTNDEGPVEQRLEYEEGMQPVSPAASDGVARNLNGQKLGRKGQMTRARILAAAAELVSQDSDTPISLSAVARQADLGMTSLYLYFNDLTEVLLAVLQPVMETAEADYIGLLRTRWPDETLAGNCRDYIEAFHAFWLKHSRLLHLRNSMSDLHDMRMMEQRVRSAQPLIALLVAQMDGDTSDYNAPVFAMASMLMTGLERSATVWTDRTMQTYFANPIFTNAQRFMKPAARLLELGIRDMRAAARADSP
jgi:AcrR family transcriptional regulator